MQQREIDLRLLFYKMLRKWRKALVIGIIAALLAAAYAAFTDVSVLKDPESLSAKEAEYEIEHADWAATETLLNNQMKSIRNSKARQQEYNANSLLMKIDPLCKYVGEMSIYVDCGYQILPEMTYQSTDPTASVLAAYSSYMANGELYSYILDNTDIVTEVKYLTEILSSGIDTYTATIHVTVYGDTQENAETILNLVESGIVSKNADISKAVAEHETSLVNRSVISQVDFELDETQKTNEEFVTECDQNLNEVQLELEAWKGEAEPQFEYTAKEIVKHVIKLGIIGAVVGVIIGFGWYCVKYVITGKITGDDFWRSVKLTCIGSVYAKKKESKGLGKAIDSLVDTICGVKDAPGFEASAAVVSESINALAAGNPDKKLAVVGDIDEAVAKAILAAAGAAGRSVCYAGDILGNPNAIKALEDCGSVVIVGVEDVTDMGSVVHEINMLRSWGKEVLGAISIK